MSYVFLHVKNVSGKHIIILWLTKWYVIICKIVLYICYLILFSLLKAIYQTINRLYQDRGINWYSLKFGEGDGTPLQYSCLENPMDGKTWQAAVHGVAKSPTRLSDFTFTFYIHALEKEMATHFSVLAWRIPGTGEPGGLLSMGSHRVGHD